MATIAMTPITAPTHYTPGQQLHWQGGEAWVSAELLISLGVEDDAIRKGIQRQSAWQGTWNNGQGWIRYNTLWPQYKDMLAGVYENVEASARYESLKAGFEIDQAARSYYMGFMLPDSRKLTPQLVQKYTIQASWLQHIMYKQLPNKAEWKKVFGSMAEYWNQVIEFLQAENTGLPTSYRRMITAMEEYKASGYSSLVHGGMGNANRSKFKEAEGQIELLLRLIADPRNLKDTQVERIYNAEAKAQGWDTISASTVRRHRVENNFELAASRHGKAKFTQVGKKAIRRERPNMAGKLFEYDGWTVEVYFRNEYYDEKGYKKQDYQARLELMAIYDPYNDYIVGYTIGKENTKNIKLAIKNAIDNIHRLTGKYYYFREFLTDNYQHKAMVPTYNAVSQMHRFAKVGNAPDKTIENFFDRLNSEVFQEQVFGWSGHNITSKKDNQPNMDWLNAHKHSFHTLDEGYHIIRDRVEYHRSLNGREQQWLDSFMQLVELGLAKEMSREEYLEMFGETTGFTNRITNTGVNVTFQGQKLLYDCFDLEFRRLQHVDWTLKFDSENLDTVLASNDDGSYRFVLERVKRVPQARLDWTAEDEHYANKVHGFNKKLESHVTNTLAEVNEKAQEAANSERVKALFTVKGKQKEQLQDAKGVVDLPAPVKKIAEDTSDPDYWTKKALEDL